MAKKANKKVVRKAQAQPRDRPNKARAAQRLRLSQERQAAHEKRLAARPPVSPELKGVLLADPDAKLPRLSLKKVKGPLSFLLAGGNLKDDA